MSERFRLGVNYWPASSGMYWWSRFDAEELKRDFDRIRNAGCDCVRIFLLWENFQPAADRVSRKHLELLRFVTETALSGDLQLIVTLFTGHMSGANFIPAWALTPGDTPRFPTITGGEVVHARPRDWYGDAEVREAQALLALEVAIALVDQRAVWCYDLGNENSNCVVPGDARAGSKWLEAISDSLREADKHRPITLGLHMEDLEEDRHIGPSLAAEYCDFLCMHGYPTYSQWCAGPSDAALLPFLSIITRWLGGKDVLFEEFGAATKDPSDPQAETGSVALLSEEEAARYTDQALAGLHARGSIGALLWCDADYDRRLWVAPPLDRQPHERHFGLWRADGSPKPVVKALASFGERTREAPEPDITWIDVDRDTYYARPRENLAHLYGRFRERFGIT